MPHSRSRTALALCAWGALGAAATAVPTAAQQRAPDADVLGTLRWRSVGPTNNAGRVSVVAGIPGNPYTYYVAGANGGIIKTTNGGTTFTPIWDHQDVGSIGAIAIAPSDPNVIYVGTGEENPRNNASIGDGMYRSIDAGEHWTHIGLEKSDRIARIVIDARNPDVVYACAMGREWGPATERGVYKTTDGGRTWRRMLFVDAQTGCSDISANPDNANIIYAGMYTYRRWAWHLESGGGNTAVYKSVDGGETWARLSGKDRDLGLPRGDMDRIGIAVAPGDPSTVYVVSETKTEGELWRSDDAGAHWRTVNRDPNINFRPFYYSDIRVDPQNANRVFSLSGSLYLSEDGGTTFNTIARDVHGDHQALWIDPRNPKRILSGSDGGWQVSYDGGKTFEVVNTFPFTQFYHIDYDLQTPYMVCGGLQDNGTWCGPSQTLSPAGNQKRDWFTVSGGDGFYGVPDPNAPWRIYSDAQGGMIYVTDTRSGIQQQIYPYPNRVGSVGDMMLNHKYRFNWNSPIALSPQNSNVVYFGGNVLFKSSDHGHSWQPISPDLTTNNPAKLGNSGGPIVVDNTAAEFHCTIITIAPSPLDSNVIWVGTDDGNVQVTRDGGKTWTSVFTNVPGLKPNAWIPTVEASHYAVGTAYVAADHHQDDDYAPYAFMTTDFGKTWTPIRGDLPERAAWVHVVREDPRNPNLLYAGTEMGIWASWDKGTHWTSLRDNLPVVPVRDIKIHPRDNDLLVATHGRGLYILDDITALQQLPAARRAEATLFDVRPAIRWNLWNRDGNQGQKAWHGENPPDGALISYYLQAPPQGAVTATITDAAGAVVRHLRQLSDDTGINRVAWDLHADLPPGTAAGGRGGRGGAFGFGPAGPAVLAGTYTVTLTVDGKSYARPVTVRDDPRADLTAAQAVAQLDAAQQMDAITAHVNAVITGVDDLTRQLDAVRDQMKLVPPGQSAAVAQPVLGEIDTTLGALKQFRDSVLARPLPGLGYRQYPRLREEAQSVSGMISRPMKPPTAGELLRLGEIRVEADSAQRRLDLIVQTHVVKINQLLQGTPHVITPPRPIVP
ncbi:MAG TPA: hypothetical protein VMV51_11765 [Gemmatimonadaceae bacterium]|nr:hypothetical protein [Gemmatimonadaceae bacterium]